MPICITCTRRIPYLYTVYQSAHNLRLEHCTACKTFADPYVEHDSLTLLLDLILLKRAVYRHLLYNRGVEPRRVGMSSSGKEDTTESQSSKRGRGREEDDLIENRKRREKEKARWLLILRLGGALVLVDAFIRWTHLNPHYPVNSVPWPKEMIEGFVRTFIGCLVETAAFHVGVMLSCYLTLQILQRTQYRKDSLSSTPISGIRQEFQLSLIPLSLLYSSMSKLFLLFLLSIWQPSSKHPTARGTWNNQGSESDSRFSVLLGIMDDDQLDRGWIIRNVLGGMSAGFGLRVILDWHPAFTTIIIIAGWGVKTLTASLVSGWVGGDEKTGEAWLAYSIP